MTFITWEPRYDIGVEFVDRQHKKLVDIINRLHDSVESGASQRVLDHIFADLEVYTETHFKDEERYLSESQYPDLERHKGAHVQFIDRIHQMRERFMANDMVANQMLLYLKNWLTLHILGTDRQYASYFERGEGKKAAVG